jgi:FtsZ-binding cell division protein ZapB
MSLQEVPVNVEISNRAFWANLDSMVPTSAPYPSAPTGTPNTNEVKNLSVPDATQTPGQPSTGVNLSNGLIAHFPFSGNAQDQSGNQNDLENRGAVLTEDRFGIKDSAFSFDGKESHLFGDIEDRKGDFSIFLWAKAEDVEQSRFRSVINVFDKTPGSKDTCQIHISGGRYPTYQFYSSNPESFALVSTDWQHLGVTVSGKVIRFYENGEPVYSQELEGGAANSFSNLIIGKNRHGGSKYHGSIDDVYAYDRAVNDDEVARIFDGGFEDSDGDGLTDAYETGKGRYQAIPGKFTWDGAIKDAEKKGGHLATITSEAEWVSVKEILGEVPHAYYLGGTDEKTEGIWEWITNEAWNFTKWSPNQPDNYFREEYGDQDYLHTWKKASDGNRLWDDNHGTENPWTKGYILEYGYYTNPNLADSDGDGHDDGKEVAAKTDPNNPFSRPIPTITPPSEGPGAPPKPDYVETIEALTETVRVQTMAIEVLEDENAALGVEVSELQASNQTLMTQVETMSVEIDSLNGQVASLTQENQALSGQITNLREDNQNLQYEVTLKTQENEQILRVAQTPFVNGWVYDDEQGWLFTDAAHYPLIYSDATSSWHYYEMGSSEPRMFYSFSSEIWEAWDAIPSGTAY